MVAKLCLFSGVRGVCSWNSSAQETFFFKKILIYERGRERNFFFVPLLYMHTLVDACTYPASGIKSTTSVHRPGWGWGVGGQEILQSIWGTAHCLGTSFLLGAHCHLRNVAQRIRGVHSEEMQKIAPWQLHKVCQPQLLRCKTGQYHLSPRILVRIICDTPRTQAWRMTGPRTPPFV